MTSWHLPAVSIDGCSALRARLTLGVFALAFFAALAVLQLLLKDPLSIYHSAHLGLHGSLCFCLVMALFVDYRRQKNSLQETYFRYDGEHWWVLFERESWLPDEGSSPADWPAQSLDVTGPAYAGPLFICFQLASPQADYRVLMLRWQCCKERWRRLSLVARNASLVELGGSLQDR